MKVFLAGFKTLEKHYEKDIKDVNILSSFYEHKNGKFGDYVYSDNHILDSGAFSFFGGKKVDWGQYTNNYCDFIKKTNQKLFFELDIDSLTSLEHCENLRSEIEQKTGKQPIVVWHPSRGIDYWQKMCEEYKYVAISASGAYQSKWTRTEKGILAMSKMLNIAKKNNTKVHGLGYTVMKNLPKLPFDSIDSTTWLNAGKFGEIQWFENGKIHKRQALQEKMRTIKSKQKKMLINNFEAWIKFQKYADANL
tara:strand:- start:1421 stop:2170 length:750 start_codon:yes stop_codon:yes gene_type:complete